MGLAGADRPDNSPQAWLAFYSCTSLSNLTIPSSVANLEDFAFEYCTNLMGTCFKGDAPHLGGLYVFDNTDRMAPYGVHSQG